MLKVCNPLYLASASSMALGHHPASLIRFRTPSVRIPAAQGPKNVWTSFHPDFITIMPRLKLKNSAKTAIEYLILGSNSLHRCQLVRLKGLIERLDTSTTPADSGSKPPSMLWVDTLCCPAIDGPGKQKAIQKLRQVYQKADKVLVLDASLFSVISEPLHTSEIVIRAYTSPWMRRLWTLQGQRAPSTLSQPVLLT